jgi:hypothetical protein
MHPASDEKYPSEGSTARLPEIAHVPFLDCVSYSLLPMYHQSEINPHGTSSTASTPQRRQSTRHMVYRRKTKIPTQG